MSHQQNGSSSVFRFNNHLNPTAQEFWPTYPSQQGLPPPLNNFPPFLPPHPFLLVPPPPQQQQQQLQLQQFLAPQQQEQEQEQQMSYIPRQIPPCSPTPTRALLLSAVPSEISESSIRNDLEVFGDVRSVQMDRVRDGIVTVHFYDLRASHAALTAIREQHMQQQQRLRFHFDSFHSTHNIINFELLPLLPPQQLPLPLPPLLPGVISGRVVWAHFTIPVTHAFPDGLNQGTLVIFNLDPNVSAPTLKNIFKVFGPVKELRETPMKKHQRFVEFFDVRDASRALSEMAGKEINGRSVMIEYSRPGGHFNKFNNYHRNNNYNNNNNNHHLNFNQTVKQLHFKPTIVHSPPPPPTPPPQQHRTLPYRNRKTSPRQHQVGARRRRSPISSEESVEAAMGRLTLRPQSGNVNRKECGKLVDENDGKNGSGFDKTKVKTVRPWKGRQKNYDPRYLIKEEAIIVESGSDCVKDVRTTVMIKNIPNKYSQKLLLNMLDNHCIHCNEQIVGEDQPLSSYDFVYLPIDFNNKCNVGYGFVNMTSPEATLRLYKAFHHQHWEVFNSRKICEVTYARVQGLEALKEHFKNSKFACENDEYLPVVFTPPRDGRKQAAPLPIVFSTTLTTTSSPTIHHIDGEDLTSSSEDYDHDHQQQVHPINDINDEDASSASFDDDDDKDMIDCGSKWCCSKK